VSASSSEAEPELESESEESSSDSSLLSIMRTRFPVFFPAQKNFLAKLLLFVRKQSGLRGPNFEYSSGKRNFSTDPKFSDASLDPLIPIFSTGWECRTGRIFLGFFARPAQVFSKLRWFFQKSRFCEGSP
jgi:hypothetical protein